MQKCNIIVILMILVTMVRSASKYYTGPIRPYEFGFNIMNNQHRHEMKDANGIIMGEFGFLTADDVYHITVYATDEDGNYKVISMKNIKFSQLIPTTTTTTTTTTTPKPPTTTSTTPAPFTIISTTPKASNIVACSSCKIPEKVNTDKPTLEVSTDAVPPFKVVNNTPDKPQKIVEQIDNVITLSTTPASGETNTDLPYTTTMKSSLVSTEVSAKPPGNRQPVTPNNPIGLQQNKPNVIQSNVDNRIDTTGTLNQVQQMLGGLLYKFNYTVGYHGHNEEGDRAGNKKGEYYNIGRDGNKHTVTYKANEFGYQPFIKTEKVRPEETPREETEKEAGLKGYEFKWFYAK